MAIRDIFKFSRKTFLNPVGWIDYDGLKANYQTVRDILKNSTSIDIPLREETFEEAMVRLDLTEADVQARAKNYRYYALLFLVLGVIVVVHAFYLLFTHGTFAGFIIGIATATLFLGQAFKFDFWSFQMRRRKLGATFGEWKSSFLDNKGKSA